MVGLMQTARGFTPRGTSLCPLPCGEPLLTHASTGGPPTLANSFGSVSCGVTASLLWILVHPKFFLCHPSLESLSPLVLWKACNHILLALKARFPGDSQSLCQIPRLGSLTWRSEPSQRWENLFGSIVLQSVGRPPGRYGVRVYRDCALAAISLWRLCLWMWGVFFCGLQRPPGVMVISS